MYSNVYILDTCVTISILDYWLHFPRRSRFFLYGQQARIRKSSKRRKDDLTGRVGNVIKKMVNFLQGVEMTERIKKPFFCISQNGEILEFGRFLSPEEAKPLTPSGCYFADLVLLRAIASGRVGFCGLDSVTGLRLAAAAGKIAGRAQIRSSLDLALDILAKKFSKKLKFPAKIPTLPSEIAADILQRVNRDLFSEVEEIVLLIPKFYQGENPDILAEISEEIRRQAKK
jgi:hypothetical protein